MLDEVCRVNAVAGVEPSEPWARVSQTQSSAGRAPSLRLMSSASMDPTLAAILPLVGVVLGACLAGAARYVLDRRAESADVSAAVRVVREDLKRMRAVVAHRITEPLHPQHAAWLLPQGWLTARASLARHLDDSQWETLTLAMNSAVALHPFLTDAERIGRTSELVEIARTAIDEAETTLASFEDHRRT